MTAIDYDDPLEGGNAQLVYNIEKNVLDEVTGRPIFRIDESTGLVRTNICCLDREKTPDYSLQVVAVDGGGLKGTGTISIAVTDINDMPPSFTKTEWVTEVNEGHVPDHSVLTVNVIDQDEINDFYYKIVEGSGAGTDNFLMIRNPDGTGSLRVTKPLDYEDPEQRRGIRFQIQVNDQGPNSSDVGEHVAYSWVTVRLRDVNDNVPRFDKASGQVSLQEDVTVGTLVDTFTASDPDHGGEGRVTFSIVRASDRRRHFHINDKGQVTVQRQLDRETIPLHKLEITATDDGDLPLTATATLTVSVLDVNDNAPTWLQAYHPVIMENSAPGLVLEARAMDEDDHAKGNGPPYTFYMDPVVNRSLGKLFSVETNPKGDHDRGVAVVSSLVTIDREKESLYYLPVIIEDSGDPVMSGTSTLTITIGDVNDNKMAPGVSHITVYKLVENSHPVNIGRVYVDDLDSWDLSDKTFFWDTPPDRHFHLDQDTGELWVAPDTTAGLYQMRFRLRDVRYSLGTVVCNVTVTVRDMTRTHLEHSGLITLAGISDVGFIKPSTNSSIPNKLDVFRQTVARILATPLDNVHVFGVQLTNQFPPQTDVRFFVKENSQYFKPVRLHGALLMNRLSVEEALGVHVLSVGSSKCLDEELCALEGSCSERLTLSSGSQVVNGNTTSLAGPRLDVSVECVCSARDYETIETCDTRPCFNGGTCLDSLHGPRCLCPEFHDTPRCQQTVRGFQGGGWAWYPSLQSCSSPHLSLEVITATSDGLILYNGPIGPPNTNGPIVTDFISLELVGGAPRLLLDLGSGTVELTTPARLADGEWHRIDVLWDSEEVRLIVDMCRNRNVTDFHDQDVSELDSTECLAKSALPLFSTQLNVNTPLQLGGWSVHQFDPQQYGWLASPKGIPLNGCVRNIFYNGQLIDLADPADHLLSEAGCPQTRPGCGSCSSRSECESSFTTTRCRCPPGYSGTSCATPTVPSTFLQNAYVKFALSFEPDRFSTSLQLLFRTREPKGEILRLMDQHHREYIILEIKEKHLQIRINANSYRPREQTVALVHVNVDDGQWHEVKVSRHGSLLVLQLDDGEGRRYNESFQLSGHQLVAVDKQEGVYVGGPVDLRGVTSSFSQGCLDDIRLDGKHLPLPPAMNGSQWGQSTVSRGVERHCHSRNVCAEVKCPQTFLCQDLWNDYVCVCRDGRVATGDGRACSDRNECLHEPCLNGGLCFNQDSQLGYRCVCPDGFWGQKCETIHERQSMRLGIGALFTIVGCIILILVVVVLLLAYSKRREAPTIKKACHDDDVRENIISYNDDGGGEDDLNAFDLLPLKVPVKGEAIDKNKLQVPELIEETSLEARIEGRRRRADVDHNSSPYDDLRNFAFEGACDSVVGSLSSLDSCADGGDSVRFVVLGPRFARLLNIYSSSPSYSSGETLEATV